MIEELENEEQESVAVNKPRYYVDVDWYQRNKRSFRSLMETRLCSACQARLGTEVEERVASVKGKGKVVHEVRTVPFPSNPVAQVRDCCSKSKDYIHPNMALREAIFRVIIANGNQPLNAEEICQQLEWMGYGERARFISPDTIQRLLEKDDFYGFAVVPGSANTPAGAA
ncbi:MAG: hypothetical protein Q8P59_00685 [Dehalococcoidia bacterium]|nr:hypothetical protein [Dehalococcoidia bacterium]